MSGKQISFLVGIIILLALGNMAWNFRHGHQLQREILWMIKDPGETAGHFLINWDRSVIDLFEERGYNAVTNDIDPWYEVSLTTSGAGPCASGANCIDYDFTFKVTYTNHLFWLIPYTSEISGSRMIGVSDNYAVNPATNRFVSAAAMQEEEEGETWEW